MKLVLLAVIAAVSMSQSPAESTEAAPRDPVIAQLRDTTDKLLLATRQAEGEAEQKRQDHMGRMAAALSKRDAVVSSASAHAHWIMSTLHKPMETVPVEDGGLEKATLARKAATNAAEETAEATLASVQHLQAQMAQQMSEAKESADQAAAADANATEAKDRAENELVTLLSKFGIDPESLKDQDSPNHAKMVAMYNAQRDTARALRAQRDQISVELERANRLVLESMRQAAESPSDHKRLAAQVAAAQQNILQREEAESTAAVDRTISAQRDMRDQLKRSQVESALSTLRIKGEVGPETVKMITAKATNAMKAEDLATQAREQLEDTEDASKRIQQLDDVTVKPLLQQAEMVVAKTKSTRDGPQVQVAPPADQPAAPIAASTPQAVSETVDRAAERAEQAAAKQIAAQEAAAAAAGAQQAAAAAAAEKVASAAVTQRAAEDAAMQAAVQQAKAQQVAKQLSNHLATANRNQAAAQQEVDQAAASEQAAIKSAVAAGADPATDPQAVLAAAAKEAAKSKAADQQAESVAARQAVDASTQQAAAAAKDQVEANANAAKQAAAALNVKKTADAELSLIHISEPTRLLSISYAVFCLKKKKKKEKSK
eukprot:TRINITY_DN2519_c0_g1_i19.p1 TRINITY_DN2519_c0_g1~~TRINITY_DN2519_c0_g1_i19.p1  ORF type:complete len:604 (-),score=234.24 TRINITY_DN2519_c0_g1_i19:29-1840(-)